VFNLRHTIVGLGIAVAASVGTAQAEPAKPITQVRAATATNEIPWFEQFTASGAAADSKIANPGLTAQSLSGMVSQRWGFSVNVRNADRTKAAPRDEAAVGAFYDFTPRLRFGGEVRVADSVVGGAPGVSGAAPREPSAGVKLESAFRF
jgi:hypothetical protein